MSPKRFISLMVVLVIFTMFLAGCEEQPVSDGPAQQPLPQSSQLFAWEYAKDDDCKGLDREQTLGSSEPDDDYAKIGWTAVCWDGKKYNNKNNSGKSWCTYKEITWDKCTGGENLGKLYKPVDIGINENQ